MINDGVACDDANGCTLGEYCLAGVCGGGSFVCECLSDAECSAATECRAAATCDLATHKCVRGAVMAGVSCQLEGEAGEDERRSCAAHGADLSTVEQGVCNGAARCVPLPCGGEVDGAECSGHGQCCSGACHCATGWQGSLCEMVRSPDAPPLSPGQTRVPVVDNCPDNPYKLEPGECGCEIGDSDGDGIEDCLEQLFELDYYDQARNFDVYELDMTTHKQPLGRRRDVQQTDTTPHGRLVARLGFHPFSLSDEPFLSPVTVEIRFHFSNASTLAAAAQQPPSGVFSPFVVVNATGGPVRKATFNPKVNLCLHKLRDDVEYDLLCLAHLDAFTREDGSRYVAWKCVDERVVDIRTNINNTELVCGDIDRFGMYTLMTKEDVNALAKTFHSALHVVAEVNFFFYFCV